MTDLSVIAGGGTSPTSKRAKPSPKGRRAKGKTDATRHSTTDRPDVYLAGCIAHRLWLGRRQERVSTKPWHQRQSLVGRGDACLWDRNGFAWSPWNCNRAAN